MYYITTMVTFLCRLLFWPYVSATMAKNTSEIHQQLLNGLPWNFVWSLTFYLAPPWSCRCRFLWIYRGSPQNLTHPSTRHRGWIWTTYMITLTFPSVQGRGTSGLLSGEDKYRCRMSRFPRETDKWWYFLWSKGQASIPSLWGRAHSDGLKSQASLLLKICLTGCVTRTNVIEVNALWWSVSVRHAAFTQLNCDRDNVTQTRFGMIADVAKELKPYSQGEFVKEPLCCGGADRTR